MAFKDSFRRAVLRLPSVLVLLGFMTQVDCAGESLETGPNCASLCEKGMKECPDRPRLDCESQCLYEDARADETGCRKPYDAIVECTAELENICIAPTACKAKIDAFWQCVLPWCAEHPESQFCQTAQSGG